MNISLYKKKILQYIAQTENRNFGNVKINLIINDT